MTTDTRRLGDASNKYLITMAAFCAVMFCAAIAYSRQFSDGLILTDLSNGFSWGLYVSSLAFFVGMISNS